MRSTVSHRFVAVVTLASLALAGQHANTGSSRAPKSFTANRPSGQRSYRPTTFKTGSVKLGSKAAGSSSLKKLSGNPLTIKNPIVGTTPVNAGFPSKPMCLVSACPAIGTTRGIEQLPGGTVNDAIRAGEVPVEC